MAQLQGKVFLGYEEEAVTEKNQTLVNYTVNKIGGFPDWPPLDNIQFSSKCPLCGLYRILVVQCYAPLDNSIYHRTLYVFACISPNCWTQTEGWICVRSQIQDKSNTNVNSCTVAMPPIETNLTWCSGADDWDANDNGDSANGNIMTIDNRGSPNNGLQRLSDEDEESNSFEVESVELALGNLQMFDAHNANMSPVQGAVGAISAPAAAAELEGGDEPGLITVDTPTAPPRDLKTLLYQTDELPADLRSRLQCGPLQFLPKFIYVEEEIRTPSSYVDDRVSELLNKYKRENDLDVGVAADVGAGLAGAGGDDEQYEQTAPLHGDNLFHAFLTRLQHSPGQILRYSREAPPILGAPLPNSPSSPDASMPHVCPRCGSRLICELQLVPAFANALRLLPSHVTLSHLHFLSVLVFTCVQSCWQPGDTLVKETVVFQPEV